MNGIETIATVGAIDRTVGAILQFTDKAGKKVMQACTPRGWLLLEPGDHFKVSYYMEVNDSFASHVVTPMYKCAEDGSPTYGKLTEEQTEKAPILACVEKSSQGIRVKFPGLQRGQYTLSTWLRPKHWEAVQVGELLRGSVGEGRVKLAEIQ